MQPNEFQYTLVIPSVDSYVLTNAPKGWEDNTEVSHKRSAESAGQIRSLTVPLIFTTEGALILRNQYYQFFAQSNVFIQIDKLNTSTYQYELAYYGKLNFAKCRDEDDYFTIPATEAGIATKIKAFENTQFEFPVDVPEAIIITLTPLTLVESADLIFTPSELDQQPGFTGLSIVNNEIKSVNQSVQDVEYMTALTPDFSTSDRWVYNAQVANTVKISIENADGAIQSFGTAGNQFRLQLVKQDGTVVYTFYDRTISNNFEAFLINGSVDVSLSIGEKLFLYQRTGGTLNSNVGWNWVSGTLKLSYSTQSPATTCKALRPKYLLAQLLKKMNGGFDVPLTSSLLDAWKQLTITSGDAIRQIDGAKVKTSFNDFFKSISAVTCAGHAVENSVVTMEQRQSYFRMVKTLSMLDSKDVSTETAEDLLFNTIKVGYPDQTYDEVNGKEEINSQQNYVIDSTGVVRELDLMSIYRADAYGIEFLRINLEGKSTTDSDSDNDVFFVYVNSVAELDGTFKPFTYGTITGVTAGNTLYNWYISPKRNLKRWGAYIRSVYYGNDGYQIRFTQGLKNTAVTTTVAGETVSEGANLYMSELGAPYFVPIYANLTTRLPFDLWKYFNSGVYGYGEFMYKGVVLRGFFMESEIDLAMNSEREFKMLLCVGNPLNLLVV